MLDLDKWTTQVRKGLLELCALLMLREREMHGYELVKGLADVPGLVVSEGTVYPILSRLKQAGLLRSRLAESPNGPPRKYYALTAEGHRAAELMLRHWQTVTDAVATLAEGDVHDGD